jgi:hypothetical protein
VEAGQELRHAANRTALLARLSTCSDYCGIVVML